MGLVTLAALFFSRQTAIDIGVRTNDFNETTGEIGFPLRPSIKNEYEIDKMHISTKHFQVLKASPFSPYGYYGRQYVFA